jgi:hypothetical protein
VTTNRTERHGCASTRDLEQDFVAVERAWCFGGKAFRQELLTQVNPLPGPSHFGEAVHKGAAAEWRLDKA